jgi:hypothetical protein
MTLRLPEKAVIHQPWGGLGDNLAFSTLPELFAARGIESFISTRNVLRNPEIHQLVWGHNPFIKGQSEEEPNAGGCAPFDELPKGIPFLERVELAHGLEPKSRYPKIYYRPNKRPELENAILMDLSSISMQHRRSDLAKYVSRVVSYHEYDRARILHVRFGKILAHNERHHDYEFDGFATFAPETIFEYCDALASCKAFIAVHSGAQSLALALRGEATSPIIHCYCTPWQYNNRSFIVPNVDYHIAENIFVRRKIVRSILKRVHPAVRSYLDSRS